MKISLENKNDFFNIFAQNIDSGYTLEPPHQKRLTISGQDYACTVFKIYTNTKQEDGTYELDT